MTEIFVDPDSLTAASTLAERQRSHVQSIDGYISSACSQFGAFQGVLNIFEGNYREAVTTANEGMRDGMTIADKVRDCFIATRNDFVDTDREVYEEFRRKFGDVVSLPPYDPPGSGQTVPGTGASVPTAPVDENGDPIEIPTIPGAGAVPGAPLDRFQEGQDTTNIPDYVAPGDAAKDAILNRIQDPSERERYMALREQGIPAQEAYHQATNQVDTIADTRVHDRIETNAENAYDDAYADAIARGESPEDARSAGNDAAADSRSSDSADHAGRQRALEDGRTILDGVNEVNDTVDNVNDLIDNVDQLDQTTDDLDDYNDYEDSPDNDDAEDWGTR